MGWRSNCWLPGMLERAQDGGHDKVRLTDAGVASLAQALKRNQRALSAHDALVAPDRADAAA